jgi:hypothetical protein
MLGTRSATHRGQRSVADRTNQAEYMTAPDRLAVLSICTCPEGPFSNRALLRKLFLAISEVSGRNKSQTMFFVRLKASACSSSRPAYAASPRASGRDFGRAWLGCEGAWLA